MIQKSVDRSTLFAAIRMHLSESRLRIYFANLDCLSCRKDILDVLHSNEPTPSLPTPPQTALFHRPTWIIQNEGGWTILDPSSQIFERQRKNMEVKVMNR